jgi:uncharacterized membrane protein
MRAVKSALFVLCISLGLGLMDSLKAQDNGYFTFRVCNNGGTQVFMALVHHLGPSDSRWQAHGWFTVTPGCQNIGSLPKGWLYFYAERAGGTYWGGNDVQICVVHPGPFNRISPPQVTCADNELKGFAGVFIESDTGTFTATLD